MGTEKRLIDANALMKANMYGNTAPATHRTYAEMLIQKAPTVDAVPVVHGRWLDVQETDMYIPDVKFKITKTAETCSECKARIVFVGAKRYLLDSNCPNCGAKMDGGSDGR